MVMSQPLYRLLAARRPGVAIDVLAPPWSAPLLSRMPEVRRVIDMPVGHGELGLGRRRALGRSLRRAAYEQAIVLPNSFKSALVPWFAGIPRRTGWLGEYRYGVLNDLRRLDPARLPRLAQRYAALALPPGAGLPEPLAPPALRVEPGAAAATATRFSLDASRRLLALCPGAEFGSAKRWPAEHYAAVGARYLERGWQVALFGSATDSEACAAVASACGAPRRMFDLSGRTRLAEAIDLLSLCRLVVSNDSGLMHVAAALGRPLVALYGPTPPAFTPPLAARAAVLSTSIHCAPCGARECPLGHQRCLRDISPAAVLQRLDALEAGAA
jgi:heptosyltransferase-2